MCLLHRCEMFAFKGEFAELGINITGLTKALEEGIAVQIRQAMREFIREVIKKVPVYTGMSRGALKPIGRFLRVQIPIKPDAGAKRHPEKTVAKGEQRGGFVFYDRGLNQSATVKISVTHYLINEFYNNPGNLPLRHPTPWGSFEAGRKAFRAYLKANLVKKVPRITNFVAKTRVRKVD